MKHHPHQIMRSIFVTGVLQIIGGMIMIFSGISLVSMRYDIAYRNRLDNPVSGVWAGASVVIAGFLGVLSSGRSRPMRITYMIFSILTIPPVLVTVVLSAVAGADNVHYFKEHPGYHQYDDPDYPDQHGMSITKLTFHLLVCLVGCTEITTAILASVFTCNGLCPGNQKQQPVCPNCTVNANYQQTQNRYPSDMDDHDYVFPPPSVTEPVGLQPSEDVEQTADDKV